MRTQLSRLVFAALLVLGSAVAVTGSAGASSTDCFSYAYACTPGYTGGNAAGGWAWKYFGSSSSTPTGIHNCTLYAAWRLEQSGMKDPGINWGDAGNWSNVIHGGNHLPAVGSIAWYSGSPGHVAYVEQISGSKVYIRADNYNSNGGYTDAGWVTTSSVGLFLHPHDLAGLDFIKTQNTGSGHVELFEIPGPNYQSAPSVATSTWFSAGSPNSDANNGTFQMAGSTLVFIKTRNTASGHVELFEIPGPNYQSAPTVATPTWFSPGDANNGTFQMAGSTLVFIKTRNTASGHVELFEIPGPNYQSAPTVATPTWFSPGDADNGWYQLVGSTLVFIKTRNTGSGHVELFEIPGPNYQSAPTVATPTWLSPGDADNGWFQMDGSTLVFIKVFNMASGHVELFEIPGPNYQSAPSVATPTWFAAGDANNGWYQMDGK